MSTRRLLGRRPSTPVRTTTSSRPGQSLPSELLGQTCRRVGIVSIVFASLWVITLILNNIVAGPDGLHAGALALSRQSGFQYWHRELYRDDLAGSSLEWQTDAPGRGGRL